MGITTRKCHAIEKNNSSMSVCGQYIAELAPHLRVSPVMFRISRNRDIKDLSGTYPEVFDFYCGDCADVVGDQTQGDVPNLD